MILNGDFQKKHFALICIFTMFVLPLIFISSCNIQKKSSELAPGQYYIYYFNTSSYALAPAVYTPAQTEAAALAQELMGRLIDVPRDVEAGRILDNKVTYKGCRLEGNVLYLDFDSNYALMKPSREILCRAALTKTLTQIEGIDFISINSGERQMTDTNGNPIGLISANDFVEGISDINSYEEIEILLYFSDEDGKKLVPLKRGVRYNSNTAVERLVLEQLMQGTKMSGLKSTVPENTKLLGVSVNDNICYVNFDSGFLEIIPGEDVYVSIYSIVNTLCELPNVNRVQITVNGRQDVVLRDTVNLNTAFEMNLDYIKNSED
jgi:hypothetical protein